MSEILDYAMRLHIFPFTALLVLMILFWLSVIIGAADVTLFDFDLDVDVDADVGLDGDLNADSQPGFFRSIADFLNLAEVPFMVIVTFFVLFSWAGLVYVESLVNSSGGSFIQWISYLPILFGALIVSKYLSSPFGKIVKVLNNNPEDQDKAVGNMGVLLQNTDEEHGRASIETKSAPIEILCYTENEQINKGERILVLSWNEGRRKYLVTKYS
ncbi:DUF1449 family protein [Lentisphaera profundi]|uniref:DUF1449 family protein n=1 Tax=Lentisphaera profundi TaxID=1658616 RepID=A0ABY7W189_9BACT|nr:OB-fold-containig protein [Lentisphaera profundi]WDE99190.1 DUF1449 family protein [Lentisphaera profundi]